MTRLHLSQKSLTSRQTRKSHINVKSFGLILHITLVLKQMERDILKNHLKIFSQK